MTTETGVSIMFEDTNGVDEQPVHSVDVVVRRAHGSHPVYGIDRRRGAIRLEGVAEGLDSAGDLAFIPDSLGWQEQEVTVFLLTRLPTFEGCLVEARIIGGLTIGDQLAAVVAVPEADPAWASLLELSDLDQGLRESLERWACKHFSTTDRLVWMGASASARLVQEARRRARIARAEAQKGPKVGATWLVTAPTDGRKAEGEPHTWAENLLPSLPLRFQKYVAGLLMDDERILFFLERTPFRAGAQRRLSIIRGRRAHQGLLLVTDRMVLMMEDVLPPDATMVHWGYIAEAVAVERVVGASMRQDGNSSYLDVEVQSRGISAMLSWPFPISETPLLEQGACLLRRFVYKPESTALRRLYRGRERRSPAAQLVAAEGITVGIEKRLEEAKLLEGEEAPAVIIASGRESSLTVTDDTIHWLANGREGKVSPQDVLWVKLHLSLMGCRLYLNIIDKESSRPVTIRFDYPQSPAFIQAVTRIRHLMGRP